MGAEQPEQGHQLDDTMRKFGIADRRRINTVVREELPHFGDGLLGGPVRRYSLRKML